MQNNKVPQQVRNLIDLVRKNNIPVVFSESTISPKPAAKQVAKAVQNMAVRYMWIYSFLKKVGRYLNIMIY